MSKYNETILTAGGLDLATRATNGKTKFTITKATATADDLTTMSEADLQNLTVLPNEIQTGSITNQTENIPNSKSVVGTEILFTNQGIDKGYLVNAVGLYAKEDGKDEEILYALNTAIEPEFMPDFADQVLLQFKITMYVIVGRTENVTVTLDPTATATKDYVDTKVAEIDVNDDIENQDILSSLSNRLAYTDYVSKDKNKLTQVAEALTKVPRGFKGTDSEGNIVEYPMDEDFMVDVSKFKSDTGSSNVISEDKASVLNGSISGRYQFWHGNSSLTGKTKIVFEREAGSKLAYIGDGFQFTIALQKTLITRGVLESTSSNIQLLYDPDNVAKAGYYVTTIKIPINIKKVDLLTGKDISIQLTGIGETNTSSQEVKSPELHVQYNEADNTISVWQERGYEYDNLSDTKTGTNYDLSVTYINSYLIQNPVAQLPSGVNLFAGASAYAKLSGTNAYFDNVRSGIKVNFDSYIYFQNTNASAPAGIQLIKALVSQFGMPSYIIIPKADLISGKTILINGIITSMKTFKDFASMNNVWDSKEYTFSNATVSVSSSYISVIEGAISIEMILSAHGGPREGVSPQWNYTGTPKITSITPC